ncbi:MAG: hypothetical protein OEZ01_07545, partial [Candidatus Heimdallarchaeota archaeon]|nr:hypothetical protein [Candidatus Heimdallarchaeota archaeon]
MVTNSIFPTGNQINNDDISTSNLDNDWTWSTTSVISTVSSQISSNPVIAIDSSDNIHIVWDDFSDYDGSGVDQDIFYRRYSRSTLSWSNISVLSAESNNNALRPNIAIDHHDNIHVVWYDSADLIGAGTDPDIFYKKFDSSTSSWGNLQLISAESTANSYTPSIIADNEDNLYVVWHDNTDLGGSGSDYDILYKKYNSSTSSWGDTGVISTDSSTSSFSPSLRFDSQDNLHVVWHDLTDYNGAGTDLDIFYKRFDDITSSWGSTIVLSSDSTANSAYPVICIDTNDNIHVVWEDVTNIFGAGTDADIFYKKFNHETKFWGDSTVISSRSTSLSSTPAVINDRLDNIYVIWKDNTNIDGAGLDSDVFMVKFSASNDLWGNSIIVSFDSGSNSQYPSIAVDKNDFIHVVWSDYQNISNSGIDPDIFYKSFSGVPYIPILNSINPNPTDDSVGITWGPSLGASTYNIYRSTDPIYDLTGLTPHATTENQYYVDHFDESGFYYYVVTGVNYLGEGEISNMVYVDANVPADPITIIIS